MSYSKQLFCGATDEVFEFGNAQCTLPARCVGCPWQVCFNAMRERVRDNCDKMQLEFDFSKGGHV